MLTIISQLSAKSESLAETLTAPADDGIMQKYEALVKEHEDDKEKLRKALDGFRVAKVKLDGITYV